jgi:hypothetical protein
MLRVESVAALAACSADAVAASKNFLVWNLGFFQESRKDIV